jgi:hypothetical protein
VVVDVLRQEPPPLPGSAVSSLAVRLWRLDRLVLHASLGVPVLGWEPGQNLDSLLAPLRGRPLPVARP